MQVREVLERLKQNPRGFIDIAYEVGLSYEVEIEIEQRLKKDLRLKSRSG